MKLKNKNEKKQPLYSSSSIKHSRQDDLEENSFTNTTTITNTNTHNDSSLDYDGYNTKKSFPLCGIICTKSLVIIFDALNLIVGILLILFGVWTILFKHDYLNLVTSSLYLSSTYLLMAAGMVIVFNQLLGIVGAWLEKKNILIIVILILVKILSHADENEKREKFIIYYNKKFISLLTLVFLVQTAAGVLAFAYRAHLKESLKFDLERFILLEYSEKHFDEKTKLLDDLQRNFKCCGATNFLDYSNSKYVSMCEMTSPQQYNKVAESCCKTPSIQCGSLLHPSNIYYKGCVPALENYLKNHILVLGLVSVCSCLIQVTNICITCLLIRRINERKQYDYVRTDDVKS